MKIQKFISLTVAFLFIISTFGQTLPNKTAATGANKIQIGLVFSTDYSFRRLKNNDGSANSEMIIAYLNSTEIPRISNTAGLNMIVNLSPRFAVEFGFQYSNKAYQTKKLNYYDGNNIDPRKGFNHSNSSGSSPASAKFIYNNYYLDIPLKVNLSFGEKKISFIASAGITTNIFINEKTITVLTYTDGSSTRNSSSRNNNLSGYNLSPTISAGINWKLNDKSNLKFEPTFRYGILKTTATEVTSYPWNIGFNISYYLGT